MVKVYSSSNNPNPLQGDPCTADAASDSAGAAADCTLVGATGDTGVAVDAVAICRGMTNRARADAYSTPPGRSRSSAVTQVLRPTTDSREVVQMTALEAGTGFL